MSNSLTRMIGEYVLAPAAAVGISLLSATAFADDGTQGGTFVPGGSPAAAAPSPAAPAAPAKRPARKRAVAPAVRAHEHPHTHADYEAELQRLQERIDALQERTGEDYSGLQSAVDALGQGVVGLSERQDDLAGRQDALERNQQSVSAAQEGLLASLTGLVERLEGYEDLVVRVDRMEKDPTTQYMHRIFREALTPEFARLAGIAQKMKDTCAGAYQAQRDVAREESAVAQEAASLSARIDALASEQGLTDEGRALRAIELRRELERRQRGLPARREHADAVARQCTQATGAYDAAYHELEQRITRNVFGHHDNTRRIWLEAGVQAGYRGAAAGAVVAAVTYRGDSVTVGLGGGVGHGGAVTDTSDLDPVAQSQPQGDYREDSSMIGTRGTTDHYRGHAQLRVGTPWKPSQKWVPGVSGIVDLTASDREVAVARTRTSQLFDADGRAVGEPHAVSCGTDSNDACAESGSTRSYGVAPGVAVDLFRDGNRDGYAVGVRGTAQIDVQNNRAEFAFSLLGTF